MVEVCHAGVKWFTIGVATIDLKDTVNRSDDKGSLCLFGNGVMYAEGVRKKVNWEVMTGDRVEVRVGEDRVEWVRNGVKVVGVAIPGGMGKGEMYPVCWVSSRQEEKEIAKLRFINPLSL